MTIDPERFRTETPPEPLTVDVEWSVRFSDGTIPDWIGSTRDEAIECLREATPGVGPATLVSRVRTRWGDSTTAWKDETAPDSIGTCGRCHNPVTSDHAYLRTGSLDTPPDTLFHLDSEVCHA